MVENLAKKVLERGGRIKPLMVPFALAKGTGQTNPSLFYEDGRLYCNLRGVQYALFHSENKQKFPTRWGPLAYMNPENDRHLRTTNFYVELNPKTLEPIQINQVSTAQLDITPVWEFIGLEDARIVHWDGRWWLCGVRRDTKPNGEGRMEMSEIVIEKDVVKEVRRYRIEPPRPSYCEKNWMPIIDRPFHFVKWTNPTEVVRVDLDTLSSETVHLSAETRPIGWDLRGGSSVIHYKNHYYAVTHEVNLFYNELKQKDAFYYHRFVAWDEDFNLVRFTDQFNFMCSRIEFCCGLVIIEDKVLITYGNQDNASYILEVPLNVWEDLVWKE